MSIVLEICLVPPFLDENMKAPRWCCVVTVDYNSYGEQLWGNSKLFCSPKIFLWNWNISLCLFFIALNFLALPLLAGRQAVPLPGEILFWGITWLCWSARNCQSHRIVPVPLGFCWSLKMFPLLLICCKVPPQHQRSAVSIVSGVCTL